MAIHLIDPSAVDAYLEGFVPSNPKVGALLKLALTRIISERAENMEAVTTLPDDAPESLKAKWPEGGPYYQFKPDALLDTKVKPIAEWIEVSMQGNADWLQTTDEKGIPIALRNLTLNKISKNAGKELQKHRNKLHEQQMNPKEHLSKFWEKLLIGLSPIGAPVTVIILYSADVCYGGFGSNINCELSVFSAYFEVLAAVFWVSLLAFSWAWWLPYAVKIWYRAFRHLYLYWKKTYIR